MSIEKEFLAYECGYENGLDDVVGEQPILNFDDIFRWDNVLNDVAEQQEREEEEAMTMEVAENEICPVCGYYCLGNGGHGCIDKPSLYKSKEQK